jgi:D-alanine-D-alanine ligase
MKVAVIYGGLSAERDVSIKTGEAVLKSCLENKYNASGIIINDKNDEVLDVLKEFDIVFNALHGTFGEDGSVQSMLEDNGILFTGSGSGSSKTCMDKIKCKNILRNNNYSTPDWFELSNYNEIPKSFFPCIVKPNAQGSTFGLSLVEKKSDLDKAISNSLKFDNDILIEEYISGREITVGILDGEALPVVEILPSHNIYDYKCKYTPGMTKYVCPANLGEDLKNRIMLDSLKIFDLLNCRGYGRVDYIIDNNNNYYFLEINTLPGMTNTSLLPIAAKNADIPFNKLVKIIIELGLRD